VCEWGSATSSFLGRTKLNVMVSRIFHCLLFLNMLRKRTRILFGKVERYMEWLKLLLKHEKLLLQPPYRQNVFAKGK
jgi:hypothetical protein